ncbi:hypothetical protein F5Y03DRAFT_407812 [Xylaria venustula]|nr:hypothetical protein F5Y03DRAFT_407812 [Xylaria venustula]
MDQQLPRGWRQHERAIEELLLGAEQSVSALYLHGPPTSELNTTLIDYVVDKAINGLPPKKVLYITATDLEVMLAVHPGLFQAMGNNDYESPLTIKTAKKFCDDCDEHKANVGGDLVFMINIRMLATAAEEVMVGRILTMLQHAVRMKRDGYEIRVAVLLLGSSWVSQRTTQAFARLMQVTELSIRETLPPAEPILVTREDLSPIIEAALDANQKLLFCADPSLEPLLAFPALKGHQDADGNGLMTPNILYKRDAKQDRISLLMSTSIQVDPQTLFSTPTDMSIFVTNCLAWCPGFFDQRTSQIVEAVRPLTNCEWEIVQSWKQLAMRPAQLYVYPPDAVENLIPGDEALGSAWGKDLMLLVLHSIETFGQDGNIPISRYPIRIPANIIAWGDRCRRLAILGCVKANRDVPGAYRLTDRGKLMLSLIQKSGLDWEVAWLLMSASTNEQLDNTCCYILVCMAAILACHPLSFVDKKGFLKKDGTPYTNKDLGAFSAPCLQSCVHGGMLWLYAGIYLQNMPEHTGIGDDEDVEMVDEVEELDSYIIMSPAVGLAIGERVKEFRPNVGRSINLGFTEKPLSNEQIASINSVLGWAFLHRVVYFEEKALNLEICGLPQGTKQAKDCVSLHDIRVDQNQEFLDIEKCRAFGNQKNPNGGFFAIYNKLERIDNGNSSYYKATGLTRIPHDVFAGIEETVQVPWPYMVARPS